MCFLFYFFCFFINFALYEGKMSIIIERVMEYQKIDKEVEGLLERLARRLSAEDITRIADAYALAREAHK